MHDDWLVGRKTLRRIRCVVIALQELKSELNLEPVGAEFGIISNRNRPHAGKFCGFGRLPPSCADAKHDKQDFAVSNSEAQRGAAAHGATQETPKMKAEAEQEEEQLAAILEAQIAAATMRLRG